MTCMLWQLFVCFVLSYFVSESIMRNVGSKDGLNTAHYQIYWQT